MSKSLSVKDLAKLIKVCKENGVSSLRYEGVELSLGDTQSSSRATVPQPRGSAKKAAVIQEKENLQSQYDNAKDVLGTLHLEDPAAFEKMLTQGEIGAEENH